MVMALMHPVLIRLAMVLIGRFKPWNGLDRFVCLMLSTIANHRRYSGQKTESEGWIMTGIISCRFRAIDDTRMDIFNWFHTNNFSFYTLLPVELLNLYLPGLVF